MVSMSVCKFFYVDDCGLLVQGIARGVGWWIGWKKQASKKFSGCWKFLSGSAIIRFFLLQIT